MTLTRHQLYTLVWAQPLAKLATQLQISESKIRSLCVGGKVPSPPRGYWRKLEVGQACNSTPLPDPHWNPEFELVARNSADLPPRVLAAIQSIPAPAEGASAWMDATDPRQLVSVVGDIDSANQLLTLLDVKIQDADPKTAVVLREWVEQARETLTVSNHVSQVILACQQIAAGGISPQWWIARVEKRGDSTGTQRTPSPSYSGSRFG